jgi:hypothetical protein
MNKLYIGTAGTGNSCNFMMLSEFINMRIPALIAFPKIAEYSIFDADANFKFSYYLVQTSFRDILKKYKY